MVVAAVFFALAFRAGPAVATSGAALARGRLTRRQDGAEPSPTPAPIPEAPTLVPPTNFLEPWDDMQPVDTFIGSRFVATFEQESDDMPVLADGMVDLEANCPLLIDWGAAVEVDAPGMCKGDEEVAKGWRPQSATANVVTWEESCNFFDGSLDKLITYKTHGGALFAASQTATTLVGTSVELRDCEGIVRYRVEEKVSHMRGTPDPDACRLYDSCDGTVLVQYSLLSASGRVLAQTSNLHLFEDAFSIRDKHGNTIADITRLGAWTPMSDHCGPRKWMIRFASPAPGVFKLSTGQWPIAALVTVFSERDSRRRASGLVGPSGCELGKAFLFWGIIILGLVFCCAGSVAFHQSGQPWLHAKFAGLEIHCCPRRMRRGKLPP